jgi:hypothetical protein
MSHINLKATRIFQIGNSSKWLPSDELEIDIHYICFAATFLAKLKSHDDVLTCHCIAKRAWLPGQVLSGKPKQLL